MERASLKKTLGKPYPTEKLNEDEKNDGSP